MEKINKIYSKITIKLLLQLKIIITIKDVTDIVIFLEILCLVQSI